MLITAVDYIRQLVCQAWFSQHSSHGIASIVNTISQMKKPCLGAIKWLVQGYTASEGKEQHLGKDVAGGTGQEAGPLVLEIRGVWLQTLLSYLEGKRKSFQENVSSAGLSQFWPLSNPFCLVFLLF